MSEDSGFIMNKLQKKEDGKSTPDFCGSLGKRMLAKEKIETLENSSGLTPLSFGVNDNNRIMDRENTEMERTGTNSGGVSSYGVSTSSLLNYSDQCAENTEILNNSSGLSPFCPSGEIYSIKMKSLSKVEGFSANKGLENLGNSSGLTPLNFDIKPQIKVPRVTPLEGVSTYAPQGIRVRGVENPQGFGIDRRCSPIRTQSPVIQNLAYKGE